MPFQKKSKVINKYLISIIIVMFFCVLEVASGSSYEANKEAAKNDHLSAGSRVGHGIDAVKDKGMISMVFY